MSKGLVIPCYNEVSRLPVAQLDALLKLIPDLHIVMVDDGSTDATGSLLEALVRKNPRLEALVLPVNRGKAEAVRAGLLHLLEKGYEWVGYADADFATPAAEIARLYQMGQMENSVFVMGSRVLMLGTIIERRAKRHYLGRVFATFASLALDLKVYDTQCGAKVFRSSPATIEALREPFVSRWAFDVELIARFLLLYPNRSLKTFLEVPLREWRDIGGSKLRFTSMIKAGFDLLTIGLKLRRARRRAEGQSLVATVPTLVTEVDSTGAKVHRPSAAENLELI